METLFNFDDELNFDAKHLELYIKHVDARLVEQVKHVYSFDTLKKIYKNIIQPVFPELTKNAYKLKKIQLTGLFLKMFREKKLFLKLYNSLSEDVKKIYKYLVIRKRPVPLIDIFDEHKIDVVTYNDYQNEVKEDFLLFGLSKAGFYSYDFKRKSFLYLPFLLSMAFKEHLGYKVNLEAFPAESVKKTTKYQFISDSSLYSDIKLYFDFLKASEIKVSKTGAKILKSSLSNFQKFCKIEEFYDENYSEYFRSNLLINICENTTLPKGDFSANTLRKYFQDFFTKGKDDFHFLTNLGYLKFKYFPSEHSILKSNKMTRSAIYFLFEQLKTDNWYSLSNIRDFLIFNNKELFEIDPVLDNAYINVNDGYGFSSREYIDIADFDRLFLIPYLKSICFTLASVGLLDIAYNLPSDQAGLVSPFDGLKYIKLSELGAFVFNKSKNLELDTTRSESKLIVDDKRLYIYLKGDDPIKESLLDKVAYKIKTGYYKVDYASFLKNLKNHQEIKEKIDDFKSFLPEQLPEIWQLFLKMLKSRSHNPLKSLPYYVFEVFDDDELLDYFASDPVLRKLHIKAEGKKVLIERGDFRKVTKRLKELGYIWENR